MDTDKPPLIADVELPAVRDALCECRWLLGRHWSPLLASAVGDVFLINSVGTSLGSTRSAGEECAELFRVRRFDVCRNDRLHAWR